MILDDIVQYYAVVKYDGRQSEIGPFPTSQAASIEAAFISEQPYILITVTYKQVDYQERTIYPTMIVE